MLSRDVHHFFQPVISAPHCTCQVSSGSVSRRGLLEAPGVLAPVTGLICVPWPWADLADPRLRVAALPLGNLALPPVLPEGNTLTPEPGLISPILDGPYLAGSIRRCPMVDDSLPQQTPSFTIRGMASPLMTVSALPGRCCPHRQSVGQCYSCAPPERHPNSRFGVSFSPSGVPYLFRR